MGMGPWEASRKGRLHFEQVPNLRVHLVLEFVYLGTVVDAYETYPPVARQLFIVFLSTLWTVTGMSSYLNFTGSTFPDL